MKLLTVIAFIFLGFVTPQTVKAEDGVVPLSKGVIVEIREPEDDEALPQTQLIKVKLSETGEVVEVINVPEETERSVEYKEGDRVMVGTVRESDPETDEIAETHYIADFNRMRTLSVLALIFIVVTIVVAGKRGAFTLLSTSFSIGVIIFAALPRIIAGHSPVTTIILASTVIIPVSFYTAHGFNRKTHVAICSTFLALVGAGILSWIAVRAANLTGFSTDEAFFLSIREEQINMRGVLLAGLIIGFLGILDDVTISQAGLVTQLKKANPNLGSLDLYKRAMEVGKDHVTSMVNTLVLVYTGVSLPMILLFFSTQAPVLDAINSEMLAEEIVRTLLGSIALIAAIPLSTLLSSLVAETELTRKN